jgi:hypothetical protein
MSSKEESGQSIDMTPETKTFWELLSKEIYTIYEETILSSKYMKDNTDKSNSTTEDVTEQKDYKGFVNAMLE